MSMLRQSNTFVLLTVGTLMAPLALAGPIPFFFTTGAPDGRLGAASRPGPSPEIEAADDFFTTESLTTLNSATFVGLLPVGFSTSDVTVELYRVFPKDSVSPPDGRVPTRVNSPSDNAVATRDSAVAGQLSFTTTDLGAFTVANSILNGINALPNVTTGGEGPITGREVQFTVTFMSPFLLPADHFFFVPQVQLSSGNFFWLSTPRSAPLFLGDLQAWIRNAPLDPDWLRMGTDIVGGTGTFNMAFSLTGSSVPEPSTFGLYCLGFITMVCRARQFRINEFKDDRIRRTAPVSRRRRSAKIF
jgi:hypothetical protein